MELSGKTLLITRPQSQADSLCRQLSARGALCLRFPTIDILPLMGWQSVLLDQMDYAIFISANAVHAVFAELPTDLRFRAARVIAVGSATARILATYGISADFPTQDFSHHGITQLLSLQPLQDKRVAIFTGSEGNPSLAQTLAKRGAMVQTVEVYQRSCPIIDDLHSELKNWQKNQLFAVICSSLAGLRNLYRLVETGQGQSWLLRQQLLVVSIGMAEWAEEQGWCRKPWVSQNATDDAVVQRLIDFASR